MADKLLMPKLGLTMKTGTIVKWFKDEGDKVAVKEPVLEIETEKLSYAVESPAEGILLKKIAGLGEKYPVASVLAYIGQVGEAIPDVPAKESAVERMSGNSGYVKDAPALREQTGGRRVFISPVAKKLAAQLGIDYKRIKGSGPNGRIVKADVLNYADNKSVTPDTDAYTVIPYIGVRRAIGENMLNAWSSIPMVTHHVSADAEALLQYREMLNDGVNDRLKRVSVNELLLKLTAAALKETPIMNASLTDEGIVLHGKVHLGIAVALDNGLAVPVIRDADRKNLLEISREAKDLASRARSGGLGPDDVQGATFTVSNLGAYGSTDYFTPIINPPQAAILGVGRITDMPAVVDGEIKIRPTAGLSLTYDHRIIDGAVAAGFMKRFMEILEKPARFVF